jgi:hypothetical protein
MQECACTFSCTTRYNGGMETTNLQLSPEQRAAVLAHPGEPVHIADETTRKVYLLIEQGAFPELEDEYIRSRLEEGFAAIERGEVEEWDSATIKAEGRKMLEQGQ